MSHRNIHRIAFAVALVFAACTFAAESNSVSEQAEVKYTKAIEGRTEDILKVLALTDTNRIAAVHDAIVAKYRALNAWHDANDAKLKAARGDTNAIADIRASLKTLHDNFLSKLGQNLSPEQIDQVKDKMTYGKVQFTFNGYVNLYPDLSKANKDKILGLLKEAREEAMDGGSAAEKTAVFQRYKGKINNYLSKEGIHPASKKADKATDSNSK